MADDRSEKRSRRWMNQAEYDLVAAQANADEGRHALACFLCHQAAEKSVVAYLYEHGVEQVWGHALADLCEDACAFDQSFDLIKSVAMLLDRHFLGARYPSSIPGGVPADSYDKLDSERALEIAGDVVRSVREKLG